MLKETLSSIKTRDQLLCEAKAIMSDKWFTNLANLSALLYQNLPDVNWVGFYLAQDEHLFLGPFHGRPACTEIPFKRGVCGTAATARKVQIVPDVHLFPGHISCDPISRSELVLPLEFDGRLIGVLDIDSPSTMRFTADDAAFLSRLVEETLASTHWPERFV